MPPPPTPSNPPTPPRLGASYTLTLAYLRSRTSNTSSALQHCHSPPSKAVHPIPSPFASPAFLPCGRGEIEACVRMVGRGSAWVWVWVWVAVALLVVPSVVEAATSSVQENFLLRAADKVQSLPGQPPVTFGQWSGYVNLDGDKGRHMFYYFSEAPKSPSTKPLVLWLNGGPGCSSIGLGWASELGPFSLRENGTGLDINLQSWNRFANVLFLDSPTGTGYSYSDDPAENFNGGDTQTAEQNYAFLVKWFERFPKYKNRDFYITGESYAGHYVPQLMTLINERNNLAQEKINLKGMMVGNPSTDNYYDQVGALDYWLSHALISTQTHFDLNRACNFTDPRCCSIECNDIYNYASQVEIGAIDFYSIDAVSCSIDANGDPFRRRLSQAHRAIPSRPINPFLHRKAGYDPCTGNAPELYFNRRDVQEAFHAGTFGDKQLNWTSCSININWVEAAYSVLPLYKNLIADGYRIWLYSGDNDAVVPVTGTIYALESLNLPVTVPWYAWYQRSQVGGRSQWYKGITLVTVRGAGHEVPLVQPGRFLSIFKAFLSNEQLPGDPFK